MAENIFTHPQFSFFNNTIPNFIGIPVEKPNCITEINRCLPLSSLDNYAFQVYVNEFGDSLEFVNDNRYAVYPVKGNSSTCERPDGYFNLFGTTPPPIRIGDMYATEAVADFPEIEVITDIPSPYVGVINFINGALDFDAWNAVAPEGYEINLGDCFQLQVYQVGYVEGELFVVGAEPVICSPCFVRTEPCFNTVMIYQCNENTYDFFFTSEDPSYNDFIPKVELPFYLKNPQLPSESSKYRKSDGKYIKLSARIEEEYPVETDWMPHDWHRKLKVALECDTIQITNPNIMQQAWNIPNGVAGLIMNIVCEEPYEIDWPEDVPYGAYILAKAKTKVKLSEAIAYTNSNCV